jgi:cell fate regulator YaaT (PSP1 superfamily)
MSPEIVEVGFKKSRKGCYLNYHRLELDAGDFVVVEAEKGNDLGKVLQKINSDEFLRNVKEEPKIILRKAAQEDLDQVDKNRENEDAAFKVCKDFIHRRNLNMKLVDAEYQFDANKLTFFFTSDERVDFRDLVKDLASKYRTRIELRQISVREETRKIGGLGICGNCLCCCSFLHSFLPISTNDAKEQNLPMNPSKLSGVCNRLKCCLLFEKSFYTDSLKKFPPLDSAIETHRGIGYVDKIDIFNDNVLVRFNEEEYEYFSLTEISKFLSGNPKVKA